MKMVTFSGLIFLLVFYFLFTNFYLKKHRGIKRTSKSIFHEDKNRYGIILQGIILVGFVYALMYIFVELDISELSLATQLSPIAGLFVFQKFFTGLEEWILHRDKERYWYEWSETVLTLLVFGLFIMMEG
ncbi:hypothetical protein A1A1_15703 [Planococcus antarcticus DSM 14505]|uniref:DUF4181 domain-containing protein n=1 Tax=Planococcus antarcticus DSM 14505 TaxID=1185653 RepID=A0AA87LSY6_9BACL|nr:DUF4181 domain-containing protein [Planococcus antarcticus]EIM05532.1 hypothetical protein A1A1_15703 [Planococcus antarcticus DSM 14505]